MNQAANQNRCPEAGQLIIELSIILPVLLLLVIATIEYTQAIRLNSNLHYSARIIAASISRRCLERSILDALDDGDPSQLQTCFNLELTDYHNQLAGLIGDLHINAALYRRNSGGLTSATLQRAVDKNGVIGAFPARGPLVTHFNPNVVDAKAPVISQTGSIIVVEAYTQYKTNSGYFRMLFGSLLNEQYVAAIF